VGISFPNQDHFNFV
jgi:hypothetical protein